MDRGTDGVAGRYGDYLRLQGELIGALTGRVLEIGAGRGANLGRLGERVDWVGLEPSRRHLQRLEARLVAERRVHPHAGTRVAVCGVAEDLPFADASVDAVLCTTTLCSVRDPERAVAEARRVLRPGGRFVFLEHVAAPPGSGRRRAERWVAPLTRRFDSGCDPTRETWRTLEEAGFAELDLRWFRRGAGRLIGGTAAR